MPLRYQSGPFLSKGPVVTTHELKKVVWTVILLSLALTFCMTVSAQVQSHSGTVIVNGRSGEAAAIQVNGRTYVDLESLARIGNGSVSFRGNEITLVLPPSTTSSSTNSEPTQSPAQGGLSRDFRVAAIETLAQMREWASTMANAIQNGYPMEEQWLADSRGKAATSLQQASASASTDSDHNALQLLTNEFHSVEAWSNELVEARRNMATAKYSTSTEALRNEPLSQKIINCGHFLGTMLGSAEFKDDPSCH